MKSLAMKLSSEQCRRILVALKEGPKDSIRLAKETKLTPGSVAKHLDVLIEAGKVKCNSNGTFSIKKR
jgi:predicted transcriptional regulator